MSDLRKRVEDAVARKRANEISKERDSTVSSVLGPLFDSLIRAVSQIRVPAPVIPPIKVPESKVKVEIPEIVVPEPKVIVNVPPIKVPDIIVPKAETPKINVKVPKPQVTVNIPKQEAPIVNIPEIQFPNEIGLRGIDKKRPLPVLQVDPKGNPIPQILSSGGGGGPRVVRINNPDDINVSLDGESVVVNQVSGAIYSTNLQQVDGTAVAAGSGVDGGGVQRVIHVTDVATSVRAIANSGVDIGDVDVTSVIPGTGATNLGKAEDNAHTSGDVGMMSLAVRQSTQADFAADGDYVPFSVNDDGELRVTTAASTGVTHTDDAAFTVASDDGVPAFAMFDDTTPDSVDEGDAGIVRMSANRNLYSTLRDAAGNERGQNVDASGNANVILAANSGVDIGDVDVLSVPAPLNLTGGGAEASALRVTLANDSTGVVSIDDNAGAITVDNAGTFATQVDGDALTALQLIDNIVQTEDAAHTTGDSGVMFLGVENEDQASLTLGDKDYTPVAVTPEGNVIVKQEATVTVTDDGSFTLAANSGVDIGDVTLNAGSASIGTLGANSGVDIGDVDVTSQIPGTGATNLGKAEDAVHSSGDTGVMMLAVRQDSQVDFAADGDYVPLRVTAAGDLAVNATVTIGAEFAEDAAHTTGDTGSFVLTVRNDDLAALGGADGDYSPVQVDADGSLYTTLSASAGTVGASTLFDSDGDNTAQAAKTSAGSLYGLEVSNPNSTDAFIQIFDLATGSVTVGTTTPKLSFFVPAGNGTDDGAMDKSFVVPIDFGTAITYACTTTATGGTDPTTGLVVNVIFK